ncbi:hypothetical protein Q4Q34_01350 [Flavivirga abyssicola]|uniref:hypothetical protein n=1 Tax=Flavivirga abyssicola TaxID=3063533 RepID=UPI0026DEFA7F|nr:hypothetical protein [Flavivirga sp. MEBiC07777]WVK13684.1 hypothetical protein Q4Q34_01350 [Flavivirga sp. MEBiC07777]
MQKTLNILGFIVGFIGLIIGLISYINTVKKKEISYNVFEPSYKIFDNEAIDKESNLMILTKDSIKVDQNIYLTTIGIWNSGDLTINRSDVRKKISLKLNGINRIIDFKLIKEVDAGISKFTYEVNKDSIFNIDWKFFDPNNGVKFQILYLGDENLSGRMNGNVLETNFAEFIPAETKDGGIKTKSKTTRILIFILLVVMTIAIILLSALRIRRKLKKGDKIKAELSVDFIMTVIYPILFLIMIGYFTYDYFFRITEVPF